MIALYLTTRSLMFCSVLQAACVPAFLVTILEREAPPDQAARTADFFAALPTRFRVLFVLGLGRAGSIQLYKTLPRHSER